MISFRRYSFLATGLAMTTALAGLATPTAASAADLFAPRPGANAGAAAPAVDHRFYLSGFGGVNWVDDSDFTGGGSRVDLDFDTGFVIGGAIGYKFDTYSFGRPRFEIEVNYRENDEDGGSSGGVRRSFSGDVTSIGVLANFLLDLGPVLGTRFNPYIGGGIGFANVYSDIRYAGGSLNDDDTVFAYQLIAGVDMPVTERVTFFVDGRYYGTDDPGFRHSPAGGNLEGDYEGYSINTGIRVNFDLF